VSANVDGVASTFEYDGSGNRVAQTADGVETRYVLDATGGLPEVIIATTDGASTYYVQIQGQILGQEESGTWAYVLPDHLGSVRQLADSNGQVALAQSYDPFGVPFEASGSGASDFGYTGEWYGSYTELLFLRARYYDLYRNRFISPDTIVPDFRSPQSLNRYTYALGNPVKLVDPSGHTVRSALDLIRWYNEDIKAIAKENNIDPMLLAGVVFAENRNDYNLIRGQDWTSIFTLQLCGGPELKNLLSPLLKDNASIGITEVSVAVAAMMDDPTLVPATYGDLSWEERVALHEQIAESLHSEERQRILDNLSDPRMSLEYSAKYLGFLGEYRNYGDDYALWLSDYNRGLSSWDTTTEYGRRIDLYRKNIEHVLNWEEPPTMCVGAICDPEFELDHVLYGDLP
jgi:RHS repeat-associated protein